MGFLQMKYENDNDCLIVKALKDKIAVDGSVSIAYIQRKYKVGYERAVYLLQMAKGDY